MNPTFNNFNQVHKIYSAITKNPRTAKYRVRKEFGLFVTDSRIFMSLMSEVNRLLKDLDLLGRNTYPDQEVVASLHVQIQRSSVDVIAHLYKCRN